MPVTIIATPGASDANSFCTLAEANAYFDTRLPLDPPWVTSGDTSARLLIMATRILCSMVVARKTIRYDSRGVPYYYTSRAWTGTIDSDTQALAWGRKGMFDRYSRPMTDGIIPQDLKDAESELAGQLAIADRTLDNDIVTQGITSIKAGSVALTFKDIVEAHVLPDAVINLMPPSWMTDEIIDYGVNPMIFQAI
jgi:DnaT-like ssDNA binding protein